MGWGLQCRAFNVFVFDGVQVKTALVEIVYAKSLRLSNAARQNKSVGEIVTLMQVRRPPSPLPYYSRGCLFLVLAKSAQSDTFSILPLCAALLCTQLSTRYSIIWAIVPNSRVLCYSRRNAVVLHSHQSPSQLPLPTLQCSKSYNLLSLL